MYEQFYNLRERPFSLTPDPEYLYPSPNHREGLSHLRYGIESQAGFVVLTGEIGCGKTTLLQTLLRGLDHRMAVSRLVHTLLTGRELIECIMMDFGLEPDSAKSKPYLLRDLARFLVDQRSAGRLALLVIDEAQNLSMSALEEIRMLSNLETEKSKLIQIILVGQPNLRGLLMSPELEQLRQRVAVHYHLEPLGAADTHAYINHRLRRASAGVPLEFSRDVADLIFLHSRGVARRINVISDAVLLFGYGGGQRTIDVNLTQEVLHELDWPETGRMKGATETPAAPPAPQMPRPSPVVEEPDLTLRPMPSLAPRIETPPPFDVSRLPPEPVRPASFPRTFADRTTSGVRASAPRPPVPQTPSIPRRSATTPAVVPRPAAASTLVFSNSTFRVFGNPPKQAEGFWTRLWRGLFRTPEPALDDSTV